MLHRVSQSKLSAMIEDEITQEILSCAFKVHSELGPGLLESAYEECLYYEIISRGIKAVKQKTLPLVYRDVKLDAGYRIDIWVEKKVVVEIKSVDALNEIHQAQVLTYLKLSGSRIGLLINFNVKSLKNGIKRLIYGY